MKVHHFIFTAVVILSGCTSNASKQTSVMDDKWETELSTELDPKRHKKLIDSLANNTNSLIVYAKVPNSKNLVAIKNGKFPDAVETSYNLLKNKDGKVIYIFESPFSESGDWDIAYRSYFNQDGQLFAFERKAGFFNSECTDDAAHETLIKYYNKDFSVTDSTYTLTDDNKKPLVKSKCVFNYDYPYKVYPTANSYLKASAINGL